MRWWKLLALLAVVGGALVGALLVALAHALRKNALDIRTRPHALDLQVVGIGDGRITLRTSRLTKTRDWARPGRFGLIGQDAYHSVGEVIEKRANEVVREHFGGRGSIAAGEMVRLDSFVYEGDPAEAHGLGFETVEVEGALGPMPAWFVPGSAGTWAVLVHGKGANRREALRILPTLAAHGLPCLAITYRNDEEAPNSHDRWYAYGRHEWEDLEAAARYALEQGAERLLLVGYSMGGGIIMSFLKRPPLARSVVGIVLDAPMLDLRETVAHGASQAGIPRGILRYSNRVASRRYGLDWDEVDYLRRMDPLELPILLFHGDDDSTVPVTTSEKLAAALPHLVTFERFTGAGHVHSWNVDRERYERALNEFLDRALSDERRAQPAQEATE